MGILVFVVTCDWSIVFVKVDADAPPLSSANPTATSSAQRDGHHAVNVGQHDGDTDTCRDWKRGHYKTRSYYCCLVLVSFV